MREKMYVHINKNIEDEECKEIFKNELIQGIETLHEDIKWRFRECGERFDGEIKEAIKQLEYRIKDSLAMLECISIDRGFNLNFDTDSGIDGTKLATSIGGLGLLGIFNAWNPMGWLALTAGIITGLVGIARSIWSFFSSRYKKSQQRKEADKNLDRFCEKITEDVRNQIESGKKGAFEMIENLKASLNDLIVCYERMREGLIKAGEDLWHLDNRIKTILKQRIAQ
ncbi:apolipoL family protein [Helicobacter pylori]|nr:apolipoL family protein [Helicobacter pylori]